MESLNRANDCEQICFRLADVSLGYKSKYQDECEKQMILCNYWHVQLCFQSFYKIGSKVLNICNRVPLDYALLNLRLLLKGS